MSSESSTTEATRAPTLSWWPWARHDLVERHFAGSNGPAADRRMWRHLRGCSACRSQYRAHALCEAAEGDGDQRAQERMARALFAPPARPARLWLGLGSGVAVCAAALLIIPALPALRSQRESAQFRERGGAAPAAVVPAPVLTVHRVAAPGRSERAGAVIHAGDALAFSFTNPTAAAHTHLMIFAHDGAGHVFWYWPAWRDPASRPTAITIPPADAPVELGEAVKHDLAPGELTLTALFTDHAYDVRQIEAAVARGEAGLRGLQGRLVQERVEVLP
jgi:hypothetical protein